MPICDRCGNSKHEVDGVTNLEQFGSVCLRCYLELDSQFGVSTGLTKEPQTNCSTRGEAEMVIKEGYNRISPN